VLVAGLLSFSGAFVSVAHCAAFTDGNLIVVRFGDGVSALSTGATTVFLDEYTTTGLFVQTLPMPAGTVTGDRFRVSGTSALAGIFPFLLMAIIWFCVALMPARMLPLNHHLRHQFIGLLHG
jgi:hypothetical protein